MHTHTQIPIHIQCFKIPKKICIVHMINVIPSPNFSELVFRTCRLPKTGKKTGTKTQLKTNSIFNFFVFWLTLDTTFIKFHANCWIFPFQSPAASSGTPIFCPRSLPISSPPGPRCRVLSCHPHIQHGLKQRSSTKPKSGWLFRFLPRKLTC